MKLRDGNWIEYRQFLLESIEPAYFITLTACPRQSECLKGFQAMCEAFVVRLNQELYKRRYESGSAKLKAVAVYEKGRLQDYKTMDSKIDISRMGKYHCHLLINEPLEDANFRGRTLEQIVLKVWAKDIRHDIPNPMMDIRPVTDPEGLLDYMHKENIKKETDYFHYLG